MSTIRKTALTFGGVYIVGFGLMFILDWLRPIVVPLVFRPGILTCEGSSICISGGTYLLYILLFLSNLLVYVAVGVILVWLLSKIFGERTSYTILIATLIAFLIFFPKYVVSGGFFPGHGILYTKYECFGFATYPGGVMDATAMKCYGIPYGVTATS